MSEINNGGPAFPTLAVVGDAALSDGGLSMRDYFAAHCPITIEQAADIANDLGAAGDIERDLDGLLRFYAGLRVRYADAMIAARASSARPAAEPEPAAPDDDGWIEWGGGDCPVDLDATVEAVTADGRQFVSAAGGLHWHWWASVNSEAKRGDIVRYRIVEVRP